MFLKFLTTSFVLQTEFVKSSAKIWMKPHHPTIIYLLSIILPFYGPLISYLFSSFHCATKLIWEFVGLVRPTFILLVIHFCWKVSPTITSFPYIFLKFIYNRLTNIIILCKKYGWGNHIFLYIYILLVKNVSKLC